MCVCVCVALAYNFPVAVMPAAFFIILLPSVTSDFLMQTDFFLNTKIREAFILITSYITLSKM